MQAPEEQARPAPVPAGRDYVVGHVVDFPVGSHQIVEVAGRQIGIFNVDGQLYGLPNVCPHQTGPVCSGRIMTGSLRATKETNWRPQWIHEGEIIVCPWHGLEYHVPTGQCLAFPQIHLRRYPILVENDQVVVRLSGPKPQAA